MLTKYVITSARQAKSYFRDHLLTGDYHFRGQDHQVSAIWQGKAAAQMGLSGPITQSQYEAIVDHQNPVTQGSLTQRKKDGRRIGLDLTMSAPKGVSIYYELTGDQRVLQAFRESVQETRQDIEADMKVRCRQQGNAHGDRVTGNALWAGFLHREGRPVDGIPDMHLHEHSVIFNVTWDRQYKNRDGSRGAWMAAEMDEVIRNLPYHQAAFDARFAAKLSQLGLAVRQDGNGSFDLAGLTDEMKQSFSRRTDQIEALAKELGIRQAEAKAQLGVKTQEAKRKDLTREQLLGEWRSRFSDSQWNAFFSEAESGASAPQINADEALDYGLSHLLERRSVAAKRDVLAQALQRGVGSVTPQQIQEAFATREDLISATNRGQVLVTTEAVLKEEQAMISFAQQGRGAAAPLGAESFEIQPIRRDGDTFELNSQQQAAVHHILDSRSQVILVRGAAGTGKTSMLAEAIRGIETNGHEVHSFAPTAAARDVLQKDGQEEGIASLTNAQTVAKLLHNEDLQASVKNQVIMIDEAGLLSTPDLKRVFDVAEQQNARVLLSGDYRQHSSVQRGDSLRTLIEHAGIRPAEITQIQRQKNDVYRSAVAALSEGTREEVQKGFDILDGMGFIEEIQDRQQRNERLAAGYVEAVQSGHTALVVSPTHVEGDEVTAAIREQLQSEGIVGKQNHTVMRLRNLHWTEEQRSNPQLFKPGLVVQFDLPSKVIASSTYQREHVLGMGPHGPTIHSQIEKHSRKTQLGYNWKDETGLERVVPVEKGLTYGSRATVLGQDKQGNVQVRTTAGDVVQLPLSEAHKFQVYQQSEQQLAPGDLIRITKNFTTKPKTQRDKKHRLTNGAVYRVDQITPDGRLKLENGWTLEPDAGHLAAGYVKTSHSAQGATRDIVFVSQSAASFPASSREQFYVSTSRGKLSTLIVSDDKQTLRNRAILRSGERMAASELATKSGRTEVVQRAQRQRRYWDRLHDAAKRAREVAQQKAEQIKAGYGKLRDRWKARGDKGMSYEH